jgi:hypothetical protein
MIITVKNPIDNTNVDVEVAIQTNLITYPDGMVHLQVIANGVELIKEADVEQDGL